MIKDPVNGVGETVPSQSRFNLAELVLGRLAASKLEGPLKEIDHGIEGALLVIRRASALPPGLGLNTDPSRPPIVALSERAILSASSLHPFRHIDGTTFLRRIDRVRPRAAEFAHPGRPFQKHPAGWTSLLMPLLRVRGRDGRVLCESLDAPEDLPKQAPRQGALG